MSSTKFYSSKLKHDVDIPDREVCGYRTGNSATKKGWSSLVRSGKNNGVVNQKLSRFSTDEEADGVQPCNGNRNWLNSNQRLQFNRTRGGSIFEIKRPSFKSGTVVEPDIPVKRLDGNDRDGLGNRDITRTNFISPEIRGREVLNFERLQATDLEQAGIKVQLGDKTIEKLFKVQVGDPTDIKWLEEKTRRIAAGETEEQLKQNPPLGRPQRTINKMVNFGAQGLSVDDKIESIKAAVEQGNADNRNEMAQIIAQTALILGNIGNLRNITQTGMNNLRQAISRMFVPKHWRAMGFTHRIFSLDQYKEQSGLVNLFILSNLSNLPEGRTFEEPLISYDEFGNVVGRTNFVNMVQNLSGRLRGGRRTPGRYLDLQNKSIIPLNVAVDLVNSGVDEGQLNGQNPPDGPPNNGAWLLNVVPRWEFPRGQEPPAGQATQGLPTQEG